MQEEKIALDSSFIKQPVTYLKVIDNICTSKKKIALNSIIITQPNMKGCTKCILLLLLFSLFLYLFYNTGTLKLAMRKTINKIISGNRSYSNERELKKRRRTSEEGEQLSSNVTKVKNFVSMSKSSSEKGQVKVLLLAYGRTGSSLTGELISANRASAYFFEPFW